MCAQDSCLYTDVVFIAKIFKRSPGGVVVSMSASHAKGPGFDPHRLHELSSKKSTNIEGDDMMTFAIIVVSGIVEIQFLILQ